MTQIHRPLAALLCAAALAACDERMPCRISPALPPVAGIKFFNFGVNAPGVNFYANDTKMTAISSTTGAEAVTGVASRRSWRGRILFVDRPGIVGAVGKIAAATDKDLAISTVTSTIADAKYYSFYVSGIYDATTKKAEGFVVEDAIPAIDFTVSYVRFVNAISNSTAQTLFVKNAAGVEVAIGGAVAYKAGSAFIAIPGGVYDLNTRATGSATNLISRTGVSFSAGRSTRSARGVT